MEYMDSGCLADILELFESIQLSESQIAYVCAAVFILNTNTITKCFCVNEFDLNSF
jgi:hypothetical protein